MRLPGIGNIHHVLSSKTKDGWREFQKSSSAAAKKGQNFILDNIRPLSASKDAKARWSISDSQKPVNGNAAPRKNNIDFTKLVSNVWLHKSSGATPLKSINEKLKSSLNEVKITNSFFQKSSAVPARDGDALQARVNNMIGWLVNAEDAIDSLRLNIIGSGNRGNSENRIEVDPRLKKAFNEAIYEINLSKERVHKIAQANPYRRNGSLPKKGSSKNQYVDLMKELDVVESSIRFKLKTTKMIIDDLSKS